MKTRTPESPEDALVARLQKSASIYLEHAVQTYIQIEGKLSLYSDENIGRSAAIVASVHRCMEHLLKLAVLRKDPLSLFPLPKTYEEVRCNERPFLQEDADERYPAIRDHQIP